MFGVKMTIAELVQKIVSKARGRKSTYGFSLGQNWTTGGFYTPTPVGYHGAFEREYAREAVENLIWTSIETSSDSWKKIFDAWVVTPEYKKFSEAFSVARDAAERDYRSGWDEADEVGRRILAENIGLLPEAVKYELISVYS